MSKTNNGVKSPLQQMVLIKLISTHKVTKLLQIHIAYPGQKLIKYGSKVLVLARPETLELVEGNTRKTL